MQKWFYAALFPAFFLILLAGFLPLLVQELVLPPVLARAGLAGYDLSISRLGLYGCSLHIAGQPQLPPPVVSGSIRIAWTPSGLLKRRIDKISSNGLQINLADLPSPGKSSPAQPNQDDNIAGSISLPVLVQRVEVHNGSLLLPTVKGVIYLPFTFSAQPAGDLDPAASSGVTFFKARMQVAEQAVNATIAMNQQDASMTGELDANLDLAPLALISSIPGSTAGKISGRAMLKANIAMQLSPFAMKSSAASVVFDKLAIGTDGFTLRSLDTLPASIAVSGTASQFLVKGTGFRVDGPVRATMDFTADMTTTGSSIQWQGALDLKPEAGPVLQDRILVKNVQAVRINHHGTRNEDEIAVILTTSLSPDSTKKKSFAARQKDVEAAIAGFDIDASLTYQQQPSGKNTLAGTVSFTGHDITVETPQESFTVPKITVLADGSILPGQTGNIFAARFRVDDTSLNLEKQGIRMQGIQLELPVARPGKDNGEKGSLRIGAIRKNGADAGHLTAQISQNKTELQINGLLHTLLFPEEDISLSGTLRPPAGNNVFAEFAFDLVDGNFSSANFAPVFPALQEIEGAGSIDAHGSLFVSPCGLAGNADLAVNRGGLVLKDADTEIDDLNFSLHFPALPSLTTSPKQQFSIGEIRKKNIIVNDILAWFEIEAPGSLFIERISGRWSDGRVFTGSFRISQDQDEFDLAIFCDRLKLSSILSQLNLAQAGGEGRLSGRIPLVYSRGSIFVDDGFLFSTPGEKGYLKIKQSKYLATTIPADVPQFSPLHFAGAALADFEYNWAKLQIMSEEEYLLVKLQVDGRPKEKLPYRFDAGKNVFVRLDDESKGGIDQPVKLDVNFNIPLNELLPYTNKMMPLFRKFN
ncbi:MAG: YdbH domain-containing protein [Desulfobulbaceae bacterium]|nr:YdbH domain-containing protein [Desulfobulbaceae bacterium]